ncbi:hypothetical protein BKP37_10000 [Anaerobacillus alkalilacustris]|uniref:histidine kinase n=1 Tax=Anaerobacillus alkalilacustris TaxID=393763 RepID=A0A1S2LPL6_9BACI|nr:sensor histidine kinase [Anaerobacillus alkalilacustris]OIJ13607.1 hypothetical protein BKP37_10000 [Anaerobacillus alkalilacustris]
MANFLWRIIVLLSIWVMVLFDYWDVVIGEAGFMFLLGSFFLIYFIRPIIQQKLLSHILLLVTYLVIHISYLGVQSISAWFIYYFLLVEPSIFIKNKQGHYYIVLTLLISFFPYFFSGLNFLIVYHMIIVSLIAPSSWYMYNRLSDLNEKDELYNEMFKEYRALKRQAFEVEKSARAEERTRIARDMHDSVGHKLTALMMQLEILEHSVGDKEKKGIRQAKEMARDSLQETRKAVKVLQVDGVGGMSSVFQLIRKLESETHIRVHLTTKKGVLSAPLTNDQNVVIYRFIQESLTNAMRHAQSREVTVTLQILGDHTMKLEVANCVYDHVPFKEGFGLSGLRERFEAIEGTLIAHQINGYFYLTGTFPIREGR